MCMCMFNPAPNAVAGLVDDNDHDPVDDVCVWVCGSTARLLINLLLQLLLFDPSGISL